MTGGIRCVEYNVLIKQDEVSEKTSGGLYLSEETKDRDRHSETRGTLVGVSPMAFSFDEWPPDEPKPQVGQAVIFAKHAGVFVEGNDGVEYRVVKDKDVVAVID